MTIHVHIDRVVADAVGLEPGRSTDVRDAIASELARLIAGTPPDAWRHSRRAELLRGETLRVTTPERLATATARAIHAALTGGEP
jgi:hypothetical protein